MSEKSAELSLTQRVLPAAVALLGMVSLSACADAETNTQPEQPTQTVTITAGPEPATETLSAEPSPTITAEVDSQELADQAIQAILDGSGIDLSGDNPKYAATLKTGEALTEAVLKPVQTQLEPGVDRETLPPTADASEVLQTYYGKDLSVPSTGSPKEVALALLSSGFTDVTPALQTTTDAYPYIPAGLVVVSKARQDTSISISLGPNSELSSDQGAAVADEGIEDFKTVIDFNPIVEDPTLYVLVPKAKAAPAPSPSPSSSPTAKPTPKATPIPTTEALSAAEVKWRKDVEKALDGSKTYVRQQVAKRKGMGKLALNLDIDNTTLASYYHKGTAIPATAELIEYAKSQGVAILYNTGRDVSWHKRTLAELKHAKLPIDGLCMKKSNEALVHSKQRCRRNYTDKGYQLIANIGNRSTDFAGHKDYSKAYRLPNYRNKLA